MIDVKYKVVFQGETFPGNSLDEVKKKLANLFKVNVQAIEKIFSGKPHTIKSNLDQGYARKYSYAMAKLGAITYIEQEIIEYTEPVKPAKPTEPVKAAEPVGLVEPAESVESAKLTEAKYDDDDAFTETGSFDLNAINAYFEKRATERAELEKTGDHRIISLDEIDEQQSTANGDDNLESTDSRKILKPVQIANLLNESTR